MTKLSITREWLEAQDPCDLTRRLALFGRRKTLTASLALAAGASIEDILWVAGRLGRKDLIVRFALAAAQRVAHINPDPWVQAALDATQAWLDNPSPETVYAAGWAADAARRAAARSSARAAAGSLGSAGSAGWAARAAAWAVDAAAAAVDAAVDAAAAAVDAAAAAWAEEHDAQCQLVREIFG